MYKLIYAMLALLALQGPVSLKTGQQSEDRWNVTTSLKGLPFCALVLRDHLADSDRRRVLNVLMDPDDVAEGNLVLLFRVLSEKYPSPVALEVWVNTDVEQLSLLASGVLIHKADPPLRPSTGNQGAGSEAKIRGRVLQLVFYRRSKDVELFRYNPNLPEEGSRTVILRGKE